MPLSTFSVFPEVSPREMVVCYLSVSVVQASSVLPGLLLTAYNVFQITLANNQGPTEVAADLLKAFTLAGGKKQPTAFLWTNSQVIAEQLLIRISNSLCHWCHPGELHSGR